MLAIAALVQIRRYPQGGKGLAIAGLAAAGAWTVAVVGLTLTVDPRGTTAQDAGRVVIADLTVGMCIDYVDERWVPHALPTVPCTEKHEAEVFAIFDLPPGDFPGSDGLERLVEEECVDRLAVYAPQAMDDPELGLFYFGPGSALDWDQGDRQIVCMAWHEDGSILS